MTDAQQSARNAAAVVAYTHVSVGSSLRSCKDGWPSPIVGLIPPPRKVRALVFTAVDAARVLKLDTERDPGTWETVIEKAEWRSEALCTGMTDFFFPDKTDTIAIQRRICGTCPSQVECLTYAINKEERFGIWGGLSIKQRHAIRRSLPGWPYPVAAS